MDSHDSTKHYVNGPEAFLHTLLAEFKDAEKRLTDIHKKISKLVSPPANFMFDGKERDKLLFEDEEFTYSRRYFWAFQTLGVMINDIKAMMDAYNDNFTDEVWEGKHKTLWPMVEEHSGRTVYWRKRMAGLRKEFERTISQLKELREEMNDCQKEIRTLRDQLFSGTSVQESRKSVELSEVTILQGHNIKLLTLVSIRVPSAQVIVTDSYPGLHLFPSPDIRHICLWHDKHAYRPPIQGLWYSDGDRLRTIFPSHRIT